MLLGDCIGEGATGVFEAPTGLGKSLAALIPAVANTVSEGKRTVIATYTNVLAEQYWRQDLPLALSLFDLEEPIKCELLMGRQRYACLVAMAENAPDTIKNYVPKAQMGIESEFRLLSGKRPRDAAETWRQIAAPPVCPGRLCDKFERCYYYRARRSAEKAQIVITNHSVVLQDAILRTASEGGSDLLGEYDFLVIDEAHDFPQAAYSSFEFELSEPRLGQLVGVTNKLEQAILPMAAIAGKGRDWAEACEAFRVAIGRSQMALRSYGSAVRRPGILAAAPEDVWDHPRVRASASDERLDQAKEIANTVGEQAEEFVAKTGKLLDAWKDELSAEAKDTFRSYAQYIREFGIGCFSMFAPHGISVSYVNKQPDEDAKLRHDVIGLVEPLREMVWNVRPWACMSATLAIDGDFDFFNRVTGAEPQFEEVLPSPFDFREQAALYMPPHGAVPDPGQARKDGMEVAYYADVAKELSKIIRAVGGRTLALFHSRREMYGVYERMSLPEDLPVLLQRKTGVASVGEKFRQDVCASLFAVRSFWTGFDAPGETLSCVVLVRVPFEVPADPPQIARQAWLRSQGMDPFQEYTLPIAKMMMRQGAGRLIRRSDDRGLIAVLDPRLRTKRYGEEILRNLPEGMRVYQDLDEAVGLLSTEHGVRST